MKSYKWNSSDLTKNLESLQEKLKITDSIDEKDSISTIISLYNYLIDKINSKVEGQTNTNYMSFEDRLKMFMNTNATQQEQLIELFLASYPLIRNYESSNDNITDYSTDFSLKFINDFIDMMTTKSIKQNFQQLVSANPNYLNIVNGNSFNEAWGEVYFDSFLDKRYVYFQRNNSPLDNLLLPHDYFHFIFVDPKQLFSMSNNMMYSSEIEGNLGSLLVCEYYKDQPELANMMKEYLIDLYSIQVMFLYFGYNSYKAIDSDGYFSIDNFNKLISSDFEYELTKRSVEGAIFGNADEHLTYNLGFVGALDLLNIYHNDREKAFYYLNNLRNSDHKDNVIKVCRENGMTFMDDGFENLKKYIKR